MTTKEQYFLERTHELMGNVTECTSLCEFKADQTELWAPNLTLNQSPVDICETTYTRKHLTGYLIFPEGQSLPVPQGTQKQACMQAAGTVTKSLNPDP